MTSFSDQAAAVGERLADAGRRVAHMSDEVERLKATATDAVDVGIDAAKKVARSVRNHVPELDDVKDEAAHRIKHDPFAAVGVALGVGLLLGLTLGWIGGRVSGPRRS